MRTIPTELVLLVSFLPFSGPALLQEAGQEGAYAGDKGHQPSRRGSRIMCVMMSVCPGSWMLCQLSTPSTCCFVEFAN